MAAPRDPIRRLQSALAAGPDDAALEALIASCFDLRRMARDMLAGLPEANDAAEARLAAALALRIRRELRRHPPAVLDLAWIEERPIGPGEWLVLTRQPGPQGEARILAWRVQESAAGPRILDVLRDGVSAIRTRRSEFGGLARRIGLAAALAAEEAATGGGNPDD